VLFEELVDIIEAKGRWVAQAVAEPRRLIRKAEEAPETPVEMIEVPPVAQSKE
jgi:hypothetical protein